MDIDIKENLEEIKEEENKQKLVVPIVTTLVMIGILVYLVVLCTRIYNYKEDSSYYSLVASSHVNISKINKYIAVYLQYRYEDIPDEEWAFLEENTDKAYLNELKNYFSNKTENKPLENSGEGELDYNEDNYHIEDEGYQAYEGDIGKDILLNTYYIFRNNTIVAEIVSNQGRYVLYFKLNSEGKVCGIEG